MRRLVLFAASCLALLAEVPAPSFAGLFKTPDPELLYSGSAPGLTEGVLVIRDEEAFRTAIEPLDPAYGGPAPDFKKWTVLRIVGRARESRCRDTRLTEVAVRNMAATAKLEEYLPAAECPCADDPRPPKVFLVAVGRSVRKATVEATDRVLACESAAVQSAREAEKPALLFEGAWDGEAGAKLVIDQDEYHRILVKLGIGDRGPAVDFEKHRVVAVTGRPRQNGCRKTRVREGRFEGKEEVVFEVEEDYPGKGQMCSQVMSRPRLFLFKVPATIMRAKVVTHENR